MSNEASEFVAVAITRDEAMVWTSTNVPGTAPEKFVAPTERHRHPHKSMDRPEREAQRDTTAFFESVTQRSRRRRASCWSDTVGARRTRC